MTTPLGGAPSLPANEFRCLKCGKLLAKNGLKHRGLEIKCGRCGLFNSLFQMMADQIIITDSEGIILYANQVVEQVTGYSLGEVLGRKPSLWGGEMSPAFYRRMWREIKTKRQPLFVKVRNRRKDGTAYQALLQISPVFDTNKEVKLFVGLETVLPD